MNTKTKFAAALSALAIAATLALPSTAEARGRGWAIGAGLIGAGIVAGSIAAAAQPVYVEPAYGYATATANTAIAAATSIGSTSGATSPAP